MIDDILLYWTVVLVRWDPSGITAKRIMNEGDTE